MFTKPMAIVDDVNIVNIYTEVLQMRGYKVHSFTDPLLAMLISRKVQINTHC